MDHVSDCCVNYVCLQYLTDGAASLPRSASWCVQSKTTLKAVDARKSSLPVNQVNDIGRHHSQSLHDDLFIHTTLPVTILKSVLKEWFWERL